MMLETKKIFKKQFGFSTLEILIASALLILALSAELTVLYSNQSLLIDSQTNTEALDKAQSMLEERQALARKDFNLVNPVSEFQDGIYYKKLEVQALPDFLTKKITATVRWNAEGNRNLSVQLTSLVTNFDNAIGGNTCSSNLTGDWTGAGIKNAITSLAEAVGDSESTYPITGIDAYQNRLYVTCNNSEENEENFFVFDVTDPNNPSLISKVDNDPSEGAIAGLTGVAVDGKYAYVSSATGVENGQLQIFNLSDLSSAPITYKIPGVSGTQGIGNSIAYKDGYVYLGLKNTGGFGPEFHIIDVHDLNNIGEAGHWPSASLDSDINSIYIKGGYAYLATSKSQELKIINVQDPFNPALVGGFSAPGGGEAKSIYSVGDTMYLGGTFGGNALYVLNNTNPVASLPTLGSSDFSSDILNGLIVRDFLAFGLTNSQLYILNIKDPGNITSYAPQTDLPGAGSSGGSSLDCEGNVLFVGTNSGGLYVISP